MRSFDKTSGVVYTETTSAPARSMISTWMSQARGKRSKKSTLKSRGIGCSSLQKMALRACVWNSELFMPEALQWAGWHYASQIYEQLLKTDTLTFNAWNIFLDAFPGKAKSQEFHVYESGGWSFDPTQLPSIVKRLGELNTSVITLLCVRDFSLTFDHLMCLLDIPTLAAAVLEQARPGGESSIKTMHFRSWVRAVNEKSALRNLKLLILCDFGIERKFFLDQVSTFPSLSVVGMQNSKTGSLTTLDPHTYGEWQFICPEEPGGKRGMSHSELDPYTIWSASYLTSSQKTQKLYDLVNDMNPHSSIIPNKHNPSVCITYGGWTSRSIHECTSWYLRDFKTQIAKPAVQTEKQADEKAVVAGPNKKRKIRIGKQMDVSSLLGAFK